MSDVRGFLVERMAAGEFELDSLKDLALNGTVLVPQGVAPKSEGQGTSTLSPELDGLLADISATADNTCTLYGVYSEDFVLRGVVALAHDLEETDKDTKTNGNTDTKSSTSTKEAKTLLWIQRGSKPLGKDDISLALALLSELSDEALRLGAQSVRIGAKTSSHFTTALLAANATFGQDESFVKANASTLQGLSLMEEGLNLKAASGLRVGEETYQLIKLLGKGKGGYSYLVKDSKGKELVLKQIHHEPCSYYTFGDKIASELRDYDHLSNLGLPLPKLLAVDKNRNRLLKEYIEGDIIADLVTKNGTAKEYIDQVKAMCAKLYPAGTNIDYYPTNFVVHDGKVYYIDYECNNYSDEWNFENWGQKYWLAPQN